MTESLYTFGSATSILAIFQPGNHNKLQATKPLTVFVLQENDFVALVADMNQTLCVKLLHKIQYVLLALSYAHIVFVGEISDNTFNCDRLIQLTPNFRADFAKTVVLSQLNTHHNHFVVQLRSDEICSARDC